MTKRVWNCPIEMVLAKIQMSQTSQMTKIVEFYVLKNYHARQDAASRRSFQRIQEFLQCNCY